MTKNKKSENLYFIQIKINGFKAGSRYARPLQHGGEFWYYRCNNLASFARFADKEFNWPFFRVYCNKTRKKEGYLKKLAYFDKNFPPQTGKL